MSSNQKARRFTIAVVALTLILAVSGGGTALAQEGWQLRFGAVHMVPNLSYSFDEDEGWPEEFSSSSGTGFGLSLEYRSSNLLGFEVGVSQASPDGKLGGRIDNDEMLTLSDGLRVRPYTAGVNLHLTPGRPVDLYVGAQVAYVDYGSLSYSYEGETLDVAVADEWALGATVGVDVKLGSGAWSLNASATYLKTDLDVKVVDEEGSMSFSFDPMTYRLGFGYRF